MLTASLGWITDAQGRTLTQAMLDTTKPHLLRILDPNSLSLLVPTSVLNASFAHTTARPGKLAFVSQSGALTTAVLDWARSRGIGFSHFISLGNCADVDFGDMLDYLATAKRPRDPALRRSDHARAQVHVGGARRARIKPVIVVKAGRSEGARAAASHTGALAGATRSTTPPSGAPACCACRHRRAVRRRRKPSRWPASRGDRLAILTNGGGTGVMATDALIDGGGRLAELADETLRALEPASCRRPGRTPTPSTSSATPRRSAMPPRSKSSPIRAVGRSSRDACADRRSRPSDAIAAACAPSRHRAHSTSLFVAGGRGRGRQAHAAAHLRRAGLPTYDNARRGGRAFCSWWRYRRNQAATDGDAAGAPDL